MASTSKDQQKGTTLPVVNPWGDRVEEEPAVPLSVISVTQALQNDLILDNIFSYLSVPVLKACRQVCQQWKQASRRSLVEKCIPVGFFGRSVESRPGFWKIHRIEEMAKLTSVINTSSEFPVTKFRVGANIIWDVLGTMDGVGREKMLREFFQAIGPLATQLEIGFMDAAKLFPSGDPLNVEFPRLKIVRAHTDLREFSTTIQSNLTFFQNILENAPQLSTLEIDGAGSKTMDLLINLLERVHSKRKINIHTLNFHLCASLLDNHFHRLANGLKLRLTSLRLNLDYSWSLNEVGEGWMKFLESQSETLEELFVECYRSRATWLGDGPRKLTVGFPCLRKLKRLTIGSDNTIKFSEIFYAKQFPSLEQLSLTSSWKSILEAFLNSDHPPVETVEILHLPTYLYHPVWFWHAARIFPNVKKLKIPGWRATVYAVFQACAWQNVKELTIRQIRWGGDSADELLAVNFEGVLPSNNRLETSGMPAKFLRGLETLRLEGFPDTYPPSTRICHFVLLKMDSLKCLDLSKCENPQSKIDDCMLIEMRKKFLVLC